MEIHEFKYMSKRHRFHKEASAIGVPKHDSCSSKNTKADSRTNESCAWKQRKINLEHNPAHIDSIQRKFC